MEPESISLQTICDGGVPEVFERELREVLANITDPNTDPEAVRSRRCCRAGEETARPCR